MKKAVIILVIKTWFIISILPLIGVTILKVVNSTLKIEIYYCTQIVLTYILVLLWAIYLKRKNRISFNIEKQGFYNKGYLITTLLTGIGFSCFLTFGYYIPFFDTKIPSGFSEESFMQLYNSFPMILSTSIIMPIIEELLYRGIIQELFIRYIGVRWGIILSVGFFAFYHGNGFIFCFLFTLVISYIYLQTQNIIYPIIGHISNNITNVVLVKLGLIGYDKDMSLIICIGFCFLCLAGVGLIKSRRSTK